MKWKWQDDQGKTFLFEIPDVLYVKDLPFHVLSPQCWSRTLKKDAQCIARNYDIVTSWNDGANKRTVPLDEAANVGLMQSAPDYKAGATFIKTAQGKREHGFFCFPVYEVSEDSDNELDSPTPTPQPTTGPGTTPGPAMTPTASDTRPGPQVIDFHDNEIAPKD